MSPASRFNVPIWQRSRHCLNGSNSPVHPLFSKIPAPYNKLSPPRAVHLTTTQTSQMAPLTPPTKPPLHKYLIGKHLTRTGQVSEEWTGQVSEECQDSPGQLTAWVPSRLGSEE